MNPSSFTQLIAEQHQAIVTLEAAMEQLFETEKSLIANNKLVPATARAQKLNAALEPVQLVVDRKLKNLAAAAPKDPDSGTLLPKPLR